MDGGDDGRSFVVDEDGRGCDRDCHFLASIFVTDDQINERRGITGAAAAVGQGLGGVRDGCSQGGHQGGRSDDDDDAENECGESDGADERRVSRRFSSTFPVFPIHD